MTEDIYFSLLAFKVFISFSINMISVYFHILSILRFNLRCIVMSARQAFLWAVCQPVHCSMQFLLNSEISCVSLNCLQQLQMIFFIFNIWPEMLHCSELLAAAVVPWIDLAVLDISSDMKAARSSRISNARFNYCKLNEPSSSAHASLSLIHSLF